MENTRKGHFYAFKIVAAMALLLAAVLFIQTPLSAVVKAEGAGRYIKDTMIILKIN